MKNIKYYFALIFLSGCVALSAQNKQQIPEYLQKMVKIDKGVVACSVIDNNNQPLEYATVGIFSQKDSSVVGGGITNAQGLIAIDNIPFGNYYIRISYIGYKNIFVPDIHISKETPVAMLGKQKFKSSSKQLDGVVISTEKEMIQSNLDKRVFNVDKSIVTEGSTGVDILENVPSVSVDLDGNVSLRGSNSVTILVDGRPTNLSMDEIPADMIESIEVVTNPSARYEPDGISGIINVVLKKKQMLGFNISASVGAGMSDDNKHVYFGKYNASLNLNFRLNKVNLFLSYNLRRFGSHNYSDLYRENIFKNDTTFLTQTSQGSFSGMPQSLRGGLDYFINDNHTLSFEITYRRHTNNNDNTISSFTDNSAKDTVSAYDQYSTNIKKPTNSINASINYKYVSSVVKGRELTADIYFSDNNRYSGNDIEKNYYYPFHFDDFQRNINQSNDKTLTAQVDFVTPIGNGGRLESGYKLTYRYNSEKYSYFGGTSFDNLVEKTNRNEKSNYTDIVNAAYLIYSNTIKNKFKYQVGVRAELAKNISKLQSDPETFSPAPYFNIFPTVHLRYDFNNVHSIQLSYSMRVNRPKGRQLNPFLNDMDNLNLQQGNRKLKPEYTHSIDFGYLCSFKKTSFSANVFYRYRYNIISRYTTLINDSTTYTTYANLNNSHSYGIELLYQQTLWKFWKLSANASLFQTIVNADSLYDKSLRNDLSWQMRLNNNFTLPLDFQIQLSANYRSPTLTLNSMGFQSGGAGQGRMNASWSMDFGIKKSFLKKTLSVSLRLNDIFNSRQTHVVSFGSTYQSNYTSEMNRYRDSRQLWITITYNFSNYKTKPKQRNTREEDFDDDEMY